MSDNKNNALHTAAKAGNLVEVQAEVHNFNINAKGDLDRTALCWAARNGKTDVAILLLSYNPDVNIPDRDGSTAWMWAVLNGLTDVVLALIENPSINVNLVDRYGESAITLAVRQGHTDVALALIATPSIDVNHANQYGQSALIHAAQKGHTTVALSLIAKPSINVNHANEAGWTALIWAAFRGYTDVALALITNLDINANHANNDGDTAMHLAAQGGKVDIFVALLTQGANYTIKNKQGKTCFDVLKSAQDKLMILTKIELNLSLLENHNNALWFVIVQVADTTDADLFAKLLAIVEALVFNHLTLAAAKDADGRAAVDVASKPMKLIMQSVLLWHGRYRITEPRPEHISATCFVFKAIDEHTIDTETSLPMKVALKLMRLKDQFQREISTRDKGFNQEHVMHILQTHPQVGSSTLDSWPDEVVDVEADATGQLTKTNAEKFYLLVMPLADRNLFVALKQERWAGKNMEEVRHVFVQLVHCVEHMHEKGVLHADLKTLNIVRTAGQWKLIDLDAACEIGKEPVGHKSSSAYVPPEAIYIDEKTDTACVRSVVAVTKGEANYELLTAHPSFDVWSLGCILYQMCTADVKPLMQGGQDDNLLGVRKVDNLFSLAEWSPELKADKLADVPDKVARNLLSQMLHKDPSRRPTLARVLAHPFLSGMKVARLVGEKPKYDIFLSYRVAADAHHVEKLYNLLTAQGFKVYWDKLCLEPGVDWEQGFCEGLVSSRAFVPLLSRDAINHPEKAWQNFSTLTAESNCDNVFLEHRLAVELQGLGLIEKMFPVFIGNLDTTTSEYTHYFGSGCHPTLPEKSIMSVEEKLRHHMESQALGTPVVPNRTVKSVVDAITACQGAFIVGPTDATFEAAVASIAKMLTDIPVTQSPRGGTHIHQALKDTMDNKTLMVDNNALKGEVGTLKNDNDSLRGALAVAEALIAQLQG